MLMIPRKMGENQQQKQLEAISSGEYSDGIVGFQLKLLPVSHRPTLYSTMSQYDNDDGIGKQRSKDMNTAEAHANYTATNVTYR